MQYFIDNFYTIYYEVFYDLIILAIILELTFPKNIVKHSFILIRWVNNFSLVVLNIFIAYFLVPISMMTVSLWAEQHHYGVFNQIEIPLIFKFIITFLILDLAFYFFHRALHHYKFLWRFHLVHHSDTYVDISTALRHHTIELLFSSLFFISIITLFGTPVITILIYSLLHFCITIFSHANIKIPKEFENILGLVFITPKFHRIHHLMTPQYTNSNYGNVFSWWDFSFSTAQKIDHEKIKFGLEYFREKEDSYIWQLLIQPFKYKR